MTATREQLYVVMVLSNTSRHEDGSPLIERTCGHKHHTLTGAARCHRELTKWREDGTYRADFYNAVVRREDGSALTVVEAYAINDALEDARR